MAHEDSGSRSAGLDYMDTLPARLGSPAFSSSPDSHLRLLSMAADRMWFTLSKDRAHLSHGEQIIYRSIFCV